jgi:hypothetical protein
MLRDQGWGLLSLDWASLEDVNRCLDCISLRVADLGGLEEEWQGSDDEEFEY